MMAEQNVMLAGGRCHNAEDYMNMQSSREWLGVLGVKRDHF